MADVTDLQRNSRQFRQLPDLRNVLDVVFRIVLLIIFSLALRKCVIARVRPTDLISEFEPPDLFEIFRHRLDEIIRNTGRR